MNEYVVGSVANLISNKDRSKTKTKNKKLEISRIDKSQNSIVEHEELVFGNLNVDTKKKNVVQALNKLSEQNFSSKEVAINTHKEINGPGVKAKVKQNKVQKLISNEKVVKRKKEKKDLPDLDFVPSDSGSEEGENLKKNSFGNLKKNFKSKESNENTVFVGNIPINYDKQKICKVFGKFGEIQSARIRCVPIADINISKKVAAIKKQFNPKRNSLVAYVKFKSKDSADSAVKASGLVIDGHHLRIDFAESNKDRDNNKAVFVGGLPFDIEDDELWEFFENCGKITSVRIIRDSHTSMGKGFGYVNFDSAANVELALQMDGQELKKRKINVKRCMNVRNKNKLNGFGRKKSKEIVTQLLCKKGKKFKEEKKKLKKENKTLSTDFKGKTANVKQKKKKKLSKAALRQRKLVKLLGAS